MIKYYHLIVVGFGGTALSILIAYLMKKEQDQKIAQLEKRLNKLSSQNDRLLAYSEKVFKFVKEQDTTLLNVVNIPESQKEAYGIDNDNLL
jgi:hypothetical protein